MSTASPNQMHRFTKELQDWLLAQSAKRLQCTLTSGLPNVSLISGGVEESIESASKTLPLQSALTRLSSRWPQMQLSAMKSCGRISSSDANEPKSIARSSSSKQARLSSRVSGQGGGRLARATWLVGDGLLAARWHGVSSAGSLDALDAAARRRKTLGARPFPKGERPSDFD